MRQRPDSLILIAVYELIMSAMLLIVSCVVLPIALLLTPFGTGGFGDFLGRFFAVGLVLAATFGIGVASGIVGIGLLLRKEWARVGAIALAIIGLLGFPIWTIIGILIIAYLAGDDGRAMFNDDRRPVSRGPRIYDDEAATLEITRDPLGWDVPPEASGGTTSSERVTYAPDHSDAKSPRLEPIKEERDQPVSDDPDKPFPG